MSKSNAALSNAAAPASSAAGAYDKLMTELKEIGLLHSVASVLDWDERTQLPPCGAHLRADQSALIARLAHDRFTSPRVGELLSAIESSDLLRQAQGGYDAAHGDAAVNVRQTRRHYDRQCKLPVSLVEELTRTAVLAQQAWTEARRNSDYGAFAPWLTKTIDLKRQEAACVGYRAQPSRADSAEAGGKSFATIYDALLDPFEPDETTANLNKIFASLRQPLVELIGAIADSPRKAPVEILERSYPAAAQEALAREAAGWVGFDFAAGRLDVSVHPFCSSVGPGDTRMTTRYDEKYFGDAFFGVLHETGHGLYGQGLPPRHFGTPLGSAISLGIHESQSRLWENFVGRSRPFWKFFFPKARAAFPQTLAGVGEEQWHFAINDVRPSFIRTEADETTYNLHILLRFELEQAMLEGAVGVNDIPAVWTEKMKKYFGIIPPDDARGCLQDIHWSGGAIGYFPTYTLGNLYAAQFFERAHTDLGDLDGAISRGDFRPLLEWLRSKIHRHGQRFTAAELVQRVTGKPLSAEPLLRHLKSKASDLYGVSV